jgi:hypothetical protein
MELILATISMLISVKKSFRIKCILKSSTRQFIHFILIVVMISSCSIQKRHYTNGYNVEWHKKNSPSARNGEKNKEILVTEIPATQPDSGLTIRKRGESAIKSIEPLEVNSLKVKPKVTAIHLQSKENISPIITEKDYNTITPAPGIDGPAVVSSFMGWVAVISLMVTVILLATSVTAIAFGILIIGAIFALLAIITGSTYLIRTKGNLDKGMDRHLARKGLTLGISFFLIILAFMLLGALLLTLA